MTFQHNMLFTAIITSNFDTVRARALTKKQIENAGIGYEEYSRAVLDVYNAVGIAFDAWIVGKDTTEEEKAIYKHVGLFMDTIACACVTGDSRYLMNAFRVFKARRVTSETGAASESVTREWAFNAEGFTAFKRKFELLLAMRVRGYVPSLLDSDGNTFEQMTHEQAAKMDENVKRRQERENKRAEREARQIERAANVDKPAAKKPAAKKPAAKKPAAKKPAAPEALPAMENIPADELKTA